MSRRREKKKFLLFDDGVIFSDEALRWWDVGRVSDLPPLSPVLSLLEAYENAKDEYVLQSQSESLYYGYTNNMAVRKQLLMELGPFLSISRGADTIFVRRVADTYSYNAIRYCSNVVVTHLEIRSVAAYYRKVLLYARHRGLANKIIYAKSLNTHQRLRIFQIAIRNHGFSKFEAAQLLFLLAGGAIIWYLGTWSKLKLQLVSDPIAAENAKEI